MDFFVHRFPGGTESRPQWKGHSWGHNCWRIGAPESMKTLRDSEKNHYHDDSMNRERCMDNIRTNSKTPGPCFFSMNFNPFVSLSHTQETFRKVFFLMQRLLLEVRSIESTHTNHRHFFGYLRDMRLLVPERWSRKVPSHLRCMA